MKIEIKKGYIQNTSSCILDFIEELYLVLHLESSDDEKQFKYYCEQFAKRYCRYYKYYDKDGSTYSVFRCRNYLDLLIMRFRIFVYQKEIKDKMNLMNKRLEFITNYEKKR